MEKRRHSFSVNFGGNTAPLILETGWVAKQTNASIWAKQGDTVVLVTAVAKSASPDDYQDFFPLTINYIEKFYAIGKIPGGFLKRETKPSDRETLTARLMDRPLRPMFPDGFRNETQIVATVVSYDGVNMPDMVAMNAASAALLISNIPFDIPVGSVRVGKRDGQYVVNPKFEDFSELDMNIVISGTEDAIVMVEAGMNYATEKDVIDALEFGHAQIKKSIAVQKEMRSQCGLPKMEYKDFSMPAALLDEYTSKYRQKFLDAFAQQGKLAQYEALEHVAKEIVEERKGVCGDEFDKNFEKDLAENVKKNVFRDLVLDTSYRADGRKTDEVRPIDIEVNVLNRTHGSALFTRGETQALVTLTLGASSDNQLLDDIFGFRNSGYMLHYNFPPYSVGETGRIGAPGRREIGHSALAERAVSYILPKQEEFPYTVRIVSEILESNGSSSMATVCGACLALMDGGVDIKTPIAGIAMGLIYNSEARKVILTDIMGLEDHLGDMDFKVAGSADGITALQMDIKIKGVTRELLEQSLAQAKAGRLHILGKMLDVISEPRSQMSPYAPKFFIHRIETDKIGALIGPQGKIIKSIIEETGASIDISDDGTVKVFSPNQDSLDLALMRIKSYTAEVKIGEIYEGKVKKLLAFGAVVELIPGVESLLHISQIDTKRVEKVEDFLKEGDLVKVKVTGKDNRGKLEISRKILLMNNNNE